MVVPFRLMAQAQDTDDIVMEFNADKAIVREIFMTKEQRLMSKLESKLSFDLDLYMNCEAFFTTVVYQVRNHVGQDTLSFEKGCKEAVKQGFNRLIPILKAQTWAELFPRADSVPDYDIVLSLAFSYKRGGCYDTIPARIIKWKIEDVMDRRKHNAIPSFGLKPMVITQRRLHIRHSSGLRRKD